MKILSIIFLAIFLFFMSANGEEIVRKSRAGLSAGMGVCYLNAPDIVALVNATAGTREADFKAAVEFFGAGSLPFSQDWSLKLEYTYLLGGYTVPGPFGGSEFTIALHMPTLIVQYILAEEVIYNVKGGAGLGYHFGDLRTKGALLGDASYNGKGLGALLEFEANTAFGEDLFGFLALEMRWDFVGNVKDEANRSPGPNEVALNFFGIGAKFGFSYYF
jgi:hypothetical protein